MIIKKYYFITIITLILILVSGGKYSFPMLAFPELVTSNTISSPINSGLRIGNYDPLLKGTLMHV